MGNVWTRFADVAIHLPHDADMIIAVEQRVTFLAHATTSSSAGRSAEGLQARICKDDDQPLGISVMRADGDMLFGDQPRQVWRRT